VEVIRRSSTEWSWEFTCLGCGAELRAASEDLRYREYRDVHCGPTGYYYVVCLFCATQATYVEKLPLLISKAARERRAK